MTFIDSFAIHMAYGWNYFDGKFEAFSRQVKLQNLSSEYMFGIIGS